MSTTYNEIIGTIWMVHDVYIYSSNVMYIRSLLCYNLTVLVRGTGFAVPEDILLKLTQLYVEKNSPICTPARVNNALLILHALLFRVNHISND